MSKTQRKQDTRERILEKGVELLSERGYHGTGLKTILDAVKVPKGSFYNYFESKEHFTTEVIQAYSDSSMQQLDQFVEQSKLDPVETIKAMLQHVMDALDDQQCRKGCLLGDLAAEIGGQSKLCEEALLKAFQAWQSRIVRLLGKGQEAGLIRSDLSAEQLAELFINQWEGALLRMKIEGNTQSARQSLDHTLEVLFRK